MTKKASEFLVDREQVKRDAETATRQLIMSVAEVAERLNLLPKSVSELGRLGKIERVKHGYYSRHSVEAYAQVQLCNIGYQVGHAIRRAEKAQRSVEQEPFDMDEWLRSQGYSL